MVEDQSRPQPMTGHLYRLANPSQRQAQSARRPHHPYATPSAATPHRDSPLLTPDAFPFFCRNHVCDNEDCGLNGSARFVAAASAIPLPAANVWTAKPATALLPFRAGSTAFLSSSSSDRASPAIIVGNPGTPPPMKAAIRREVPLPSQEGKKGAMQYALYVIRMQGRRAQRLMGAAPHSTKSPTGRVRAPSGP
jgi:hypothetical protein